MSKNTLTLFMAFMLMAPIFCAHAQQPSLSALDRAELAYLDGDYAAVVRYTNDALNDNPGAHEAFFLRGAAYWKTGKWSLAHKDLATYAETGGEFEQEAQSLLKQLVTPPASRLRSEVRAGVLYSDRVVRPNKPIDDPDRESEDLGTRFGWAIKTQSHEWLSILYRGTHLQYLEVSEASWHNEALDAIATWYTPTGQASVEWRVGGEYVRRDAGPDIWRIRSRADTTWAIAPQRHIGWLGFELGYDRYPFDDDFSGQTWLLNGGMEHYFSRLTLFWDAYVLGHDAKEDSLSFTENGGRIGIAFVATEKLTAGTSLRALNAEFDRYERVFGIDRSDDYYAAELWARFHLGPGWALGPYLEYTTNGSSFESLDFDRTIFGVDLVLNLL
jgi:hypothetical protein